MLKRAISAHNGFTAKVVSQMGFDYIWASSLEISSSFAVPDASILTFSQFKEVSSYIAKASKIPVILDADSGYGNHINVAYYFKELKEAGIKGVCIEDNLFPKQNSFYSNDIKIEEPKVFARKVEIAKSIFNDDDEFIIARTEALIRGLGTQNALQRCELYAEAGADLIMPHSKISTPKQIIDFAKKWDRPEKLVAVPSKYPDTTATELSEYNFDLVIYANHTIRTIKKALEDTLPQIITDDTSKNIEKKISPIKEILELAGEKEIEELTMKFKDK